MKRPLHRIEHATCPRGAANWAECDRLRDEWYHDWQAMQAVLHAMLIVIRDEGKPSPWWRKGTSMDEQLIQMIAGQREYIVNGDGNPSESVWVKRFLAAIERVKAGDLPRYNLYGMPGTIEEALRQREERRADATPALAG